MATSSVDYGILYKVLLVAYEKAIRDVLGRRPKIVSMRAYEYEMKMLLEYAKDKLGIEAPKTTSLGELTNWCIDFLSKMGIISPETIKVLSHDETITVQVTNCPYVSILKELKQEHIKEGITCPIVGCLRALLTILTNEKFEYELQEMKPGEMCKAIIKKLKLRVT